MCIARLPLHDLPHTPLPGDHDIISIRLKREIRQRRAVARRIRVVHPLRQLEQVTLAVGVVVHLVLAHGRHVPQPVHQVAGPVAVDVAGGQVEAARAEGRQGEARRVGERADDGLGAGVGAAVVACPAWGSVRVGGERGREGEGRGGEEVPSCVAQFWSGSSQRKTMPARLPLAILSSQPMTGAVGPGPKYFWKMWEVLRWMRTVGGVVSFQIQRASTDTNGIWDWEDYTVFLRMLGDQDSLLEPCCDLTTLGCVAGLVDGEFGDVARRPVVRWGRGGWARERGRGGRERGVRGRNRQGCCVEGLEGGPEEDSRDAHLDWSLET